MGESEHRLYRIKDLEQGERPRERLAILGPEALSDSELLAILLRTGLRGMNAVQLARNLLLDSGGLTGLHRKSFGELCQMRGIGAAKAAQLKAAIELGRRLATARPEERPKIQSPEDAAAQVLYEMGATHRSSESGSSSGRRSGRMPLPSSWCTIIQAAIPRPARRMSRSHAPSWKPGKPWTLRFSIIL